MRLVTGRPEPLRKRIDDLKGAMSLDDLAYEARRYTSRKLSGSEISAIARWKRPQSSEVLQAIARGLKQDPDEWPEHRAARWRERLADPTTFHVALGEIERATGHAGSELRVPEGTLAHDVGDGTPKTRGRRRSGSQ